MDEEQILYVHMFMLNILNIQHFNYIYKNSYYMINRGFCIDLVKASSAILISIWLLYQK